MLSSKDYASINQKMVKFLPETESQYAKYPMNYNRWLDPSKKEKGPKGERLFLKEPDMGMKMDYVWGRGAYGEGYYHLLTRYAYPNLYSRIMHEMPQSCCLFNKDARQRYDEWDDVKTVMFFRSKATRPCDAVAARDGMNEAKDVGQIWYNATQNEALAFNIVNTLNPI